MKNFLLLSRFYMRRLVFVVPAAVAAWLYAMLVSGALPPRGQMLPNADRMVQIIHLGLFPDKPRNMSFMDYFRSFTEHDKNLTKVLERLEFNILDAENLENVIKLAEDVKRLKEMKLEAQARAAADAKTSAPDARRYSYKPHEIFTYKKFPNAWNLDTRRKVVEFMQHSVYTTRYEVNKLRNLRKRYRNSTVFQIGMIYGNQLELKVVAGQVLSTMLRMPLNVSTLWYVFHYNKLLNLAYDIGSNTEQIYLLNKRLKDGFTHLKYARGEGGADALPLDSHEATSRDPDSLYKKKKK